MLKHFLNPPNWFTSAGLFCGMYAIVLATGIQGEANYYRAAVMILFAVVFDMLDGRVARMTGTGSDFGIQLDSLVDVVAFGLAPAILMYAWGMDALGWVGLVGAFFFALCGAFRLARFNTKADGKAKTWTEGLTITAAGGTVASAVMAHGASGRTDVEHPLNVMLLAIALAFLMVSRVPYRTWKTEVKTRLGVATFTLFVGSLLTVSVAYNVQMAFIVFGIVYVSSGPIDMLINHRRYVDEAVPVGIDDDGEPPIGT